ncbi:TPA: hypothetical protein MAR07_005296 [Klebsiella pneumoniae]|uniref:hypothetical protein n=1 Tax=Klebsiella pneumoniae TaxID=573 RepID=UPI001E4830AB|nr:hypothetical protein [Klebsiella pneumoniae]MCD5937003.1 hypothetical protein [Klebsiella pneumoniae]HBS7549508.1 hypothetical protein [Klebsiella pneumoniae]HBU3718200.1 hypothetical protein [Klebsiella pneumoniae]HBX5355693.1 hypothetical protein [Klebsiella pneumoniae]HBY4307915.1 hypothetical protein [Klebsiella pneumoniae]
MEFKNEKIAGAAVVLAQMARSICERETMKAAREFLFWKMDNAPDCQANKLALIALFNDAIRTGRKAVFIAACNDIEQAAAAAAAEFWSAKRAQRVIKKCAAEGLAGVTREQVEGTEAARADRYYSVSAAVSELLSAKRAIPVHQMEIDATGAETFTETTLAIDQETADAIERFDRDTRPDTEQ